MSLQRPDLYFFHQPILADAPLSDSPSLSTPASKALTQGDPLVDKGGQDIVLLGAILLVIGVVALVGFFSRKIEHVIAAALVMSGFFSRKIEHVIAAALVMSLVMIGFFLATHH
jgi:hypothetical protein